ncbi:MAG: hypothetical protein JWQ71_4264 [Pedosphaera sp.]|nr:hypothetical protein [Pedosphaera sp.]
MKINPVISASVCLVVLALGNSSALADEFLANGDFEAEPLGLGSATNTFPGWFEGSNGATVTTNAAAISGNHSVLIIKASGGDLHQNLTNVIGWQSDWIFEGDFACSNPGGGGARSLQLGLFHTSTANISFRIVDVEPNGVGDVQLFNGSAFVTVLSNAVTFSSSPTNLNVNHLKIVGHYFATNTPNYDIFVTSASQQTSSVSNQVFWQIAPPPANTNTHLVQVRFDTANVVAGTFEVLDNLTLSVATVVPTAVSITTQPAGVSVYQGYTGPFSLSAQTSGTTPIAYQWKLNGVDVPGATDKTITLSNLNSTTTGNYSLFATNIAGSTLSSNALVSLLSTFNTAQMTNIWNIAPGDQPFLTKNNTERGLAFNPVSSNLLVATRYASPTNNIAVLDPLTGSLKYYMNLSGIPIDTVGTTLGVSTVAVADDGVVYGGGLTTSAGSASTPYDLYQWGADDSNTPPMNIFAGDPGFSTPAANLRWGDNLAVRGAGTGTQILIAPGTGTNVAFFTTSDGFDFLPVILSVSNVPSGFAKTGLAFGPGSNTFWAKSSGGSLYLIQFDLNTATGNAIQTFGTNNVSAALRGIAVNPTGKWLVGTASGIPDNVQLYDISNLASGPALVDQELYSTANANNNIVGGVGSAAFNGNYLFVLDQNNGIKAFLIDPSFVPAPSPFRITSIGLVPGTGVVMTWQSAIGRNYQVQSKAMLGNSAWTNLGTPITATGTFTSSTNSVSGATQFYRVQTQ